MASEIYGIMLNRSEEKQITETFKVQEFYVDCSEFDRFTGQKKFDNKLKFQVSNTKIDELKKINRGDLIKIQFNPQGREYDKQDGSGKGHAQNLNAWKIEVVKPKETAEPQTQNQSSQQPFRFEQPTTGNTSEDDDLPF